jgi:Uma2 family endonuclease
MSSAPERFEEKEYYTYADYLGWDEDFHAEIINGVAHAMSPPLTIHQRISRRLFVKLASFLEGKTCEVFAAPFGVRLFPRDDRSDDTVVEPDIVVVCDPSKIDERGCNGAPDLIMEILSPSTLRRDRVLKFNLYLKAKIPEYWLVSPDDNAIDVYIYENGRYFTQRYGLNELGVKENERIQELVSVSLLPGLIIDLKDIFKDK